MGAFFRTITEGIGSILSFFYDVVPSYGLAIVLLTISVRVVLIPLTLKQTRSMQGMQKIQPQVKALQQKYKGNRQKLNEEMMKLYKHHEVNPLGGCLPLVLQLPVFIMLYQVLVAGGGTRYLPEAGALAAGIKAQTVAFLGMNLSCSPSQAGRGLAEIRGGTTTLDCGSGWAVAVPFFVMVGLMVFTTFYQQRQMQASSGQPQQAQMLMRIMPAFLGFISLTIPAGVLVYWVTTNLWQVGQQHVMLRARAQDEVEGLRTTPPKPSGGKPGRGRRAGSRKKRPKR